MNHIKNIEKLEKFPNDIDLFKTSISTLEFALKSVDPGILIKNALSLDKKSNILHVKDTKENILNIKLDYF
ncbi:MAG: hypothetical protein ACPKPY_05170, partial [Nitrososphaeraceae archaeon]